MFIVADLVSLSSVVYKLFVLLSVIIDCAEDRPVTYKNGNCVIARYALLKILPLKK